MLLKSKKKANLEISFIPIINIVFLLLIFFMVQGNLQQNKDLPNLKTPTSRTSIESRANEYQVINLDQNNITINNRVYSQQNLNEKIEYLVSINPDQEFLIRASDQSNAKDMLAIISLLKTKGALGVSLATMSKNQ